MAAEKGFEAEDLYKAGFCSVAGWPLIFAFLFLFSFKEWNEKNDGEKFGTGNRGMRDAGAASSMNRLAAYMSLLNRITGR